MLRFDRVGMVAAVVGVVAVGLATGANARDATRDYPNSAVCPVHSPGPTSPTDPLQFRATSTVASLTFATCDGRSIGPSDLAESYSLNVSIDNLYVVEASTFNKYRVTYAEALAKPEFYDFAPDCYRVSENGNERFPTVETVFDRKKRYKKWAVPFFENFDGSSSSWQLGNACFAPDTGGDACASSSIAAGNRSLILSRSVRGGGQCSIATVRVDGLLPGRDYVVDFSWKVSGLGGQMPKPALSVFVNDVPSGWPGGR